jgi:hypothetical protein
MNIVPINRIAVRLGLAMSCIVLTACGPDLVGAAATGAASKKQELEQGQAAQKQINEQLQKAMEQVQQRNEKLEEPQSR